jgi:hypothetical protein
MINEISTRTMTPIELQRIGFDTLVKSLGVVDATRFIHLYDSGSGDYTEERHEWLDKLTVNDIIGELKNITK